MASNIRFVADGKCDGCPFMDLETVTLYGNGVQQTTTFNCRRADLCDMLEVYLRRKLAEEADGCHA